MFDPGAPRLPLAELGDESARTQGYWDWLEAKGAIDGSKMLERLSNRSEWRELRSASDADFEAFTMRHSIGHSWDRYSAMGRILSFRNPAGKPEFTALLADGVFVHVREHRNARLANVNRTALDEFAERNCLEVAPEQPGFDCFDRGEGSNTRIRYLQRECDNSKKFGELVVEGRLHEDAIRRIRDTTDERGSFDAGRGGLPLLSEAPEGYELLCIDFVDSVPGHPLLAAAAFALAWDQAPDSSASFNR